MPRITNWRRESRSPTLAYRNTETGARAVLHRAPDSDRYKWRGAILVDGYPVWSHGYEMKDAKSFRNELRKRPSPELSCPECLHDDIVVGGKSADGAKVQRWFECRNCGYESPSCLVYGAER
ncbi:DUF7568 family protein [Haloferax volcanii]|uniref:Small CPxCG-related zinc finger protein n=3 Tax=Haloferax volcanii TaxID=2246 RepID=A0A384LDS1_HALVD|nr:hypothetical protein [Haloferax volcanii]ADE01888.1 small CPxCG-related zinc finger protein [Haloferax volcanii DS2]ELY28676.1 hypothetical protein C498_11076 [Haloferax volcanii DS2]MBS8120960.1 hypothetical protein [Haloferax volcanii]MBS8125997.1 hypothetical protein [Haloferax volcanii]MBS8129850.1 hypothetical protein [Haloferax volcanii]